MDKIKFKTIDEYIVVFPKDVQAILINLRNTIKEAAPEATEKIIYVIPTFYLKGNLVHFAAYKNHISFYPTLSGIKKFEKVILQYKNSKGAVQFPIDKPLPLKLITDIVKFRVDENKKRK